MCLCVAVWASSDGGRQWFIIAGETIDRHCASSCATSFSARLQAAVITDDESGRVWLLGGSTVNPTLFHDDIWTSADMIRWFRLDNVTSVFSARDAAAAIVDGNRTMYVVAGKHENNIRLQDVWTSLDATSWTLRCENAPFSPRDNAQLAIVKSDLLDAQILTLIGGVVHTLSYDVPVNDGQYSTQVQDSYRLTSLNMHC